jgi:hypothetical protein
VLRLYLYARVRLPVHSLHTRPRVQQAPGIPCSLSFGGQGGLGKPRALCVARMRNCIHVIACDKRKAFAQGSECDEAIHVSASGEMDCFASLAMTVERSLAGYPCGVTEILAQSRRPIRMQSWVLRRSAMLTASQMPIAVNATVNASAATLASMR